MTIVPRKLNQGMIVALSGYIEKGYFANRACYLCDINAKTLYDWINQAERDEQDGQTEDDSLYISLSNSIKKAHAVAQARLIDVMMNAATVDKNWTAAARTLESTDRENWWRTDKVVIDNSKTLNITRVEIAMPDTKYLEGEYNVIEGTGQGEDEKDEGA